MSSRKKRRMFRRAKARARVAFGEKGGNALHGVLLIALFSCSAFYIAEIPFVKSLSFSPLIVGIILGMFYANSLRNRLPEAWTPGIRYCSKQILRAGIVLYGFRLTLADVAAVGVPAVAVDAVVVAGTLLLGGAFGRGVEVDQGTGLVAAAGRLVCGAGGGRGAVGARGSSRGAGNLSAGPCLRN